jgi:hypothetical protein
MGKLSVSTSPRALQRIAFIAVVLFGLFMAGAVHVAEKTAAQIRSTHYSSLETALSSGALDESKASSTKTQQF